MALVCRLDASFQNIKLRVNVKVDSLTRKGVGHHSILIT